MKGLLMIGSPFWFNLPHPNKKYVLKLQTSSSDLELKIVSTAVQIHDVI